MSCKEIKKPISVALAHFCGVTLATLADFRCHLDIPVLNCEETVIVDPMKPSEQLQHVNYKPTVTSVF